jgi:hypothetical protein
MSLTKERFKFANAALVAALALAMSGCGDEALGTSVPSNPSTPESPTEQPDSTPGTETPSTGTDLVVFKDAVNPNWQTWDCCGGTTPIYPVELGDYGLTAEFRVGATPAVLGFVRPEGMSGIDVSELETSGILEFEIKLRNSPGDQVNWFVKLESNGGDQEGASGEAVDISIPSPQVGVWTKIEVSLSDLANQGIDLTNVDKVLIYPEWDQGEGAIYRVDNVAFVDAAPSSPDGEEPDSPASDSGEKLDLSAPLTDFEGAFSEQGVANPVLSNEAASAWASGGISQVSSSATVIKTLKPVGAQPWAGTTLGDSSILEITPERSVISLWVYSPEVGVPVLLKVENAALTQPAPNPEMAEVLVYTSVANQWEKLEFDFTDLNAGELDPNYTFDMKTVFFDFMEDAADKEFYWDDMTFVEVSDPVEPEEPEEPVQPPVEESEEIVIFNDAANPAWAAWDCCGGSTPSVITDSDVQYDQVTQFEINAPTVVGFTSRSADGAVGGAPVDVSAWRDTGTVSFDMKLTADAGAQDWKFKVESVAGAAVEVSLPELPEVDVWKRYTFNLSDLADAGANLSAMDLLMIFPAWGSGVGSVFSVDNLSFSSVGNVAPVEPETPDGPVLPPIDNPDNLTVNGDFESGALDPWYAIGGGVTIENGAARLQAGNGAESRIKTNGIGAGVINPGQTVNISFSYRGEAVDGGVANAIIHFIADGVVGTEEINIPAPTSEWQTLSKDIVASAGTSGGVDFTIGGVCGADATCSVDLYLDNITVVAVAGTGEEPENPGEAPILPPDDGTGNLIVNGDFSTNELAPWGQVGAGEVVVADGAVTASAVNGGEARIKAEKVGQGELTANQSVTLSFQAKGFAASGGVVNGVLHTTSPRGTSKTDNFDILNLTTVWQEYSYDFDIGSDAEWGVDLTLGPVCGAVPGCQVEVSFDNIRLELK